MTIYSGKAKELLEEMSGALREASDKIMEASRTNSFIDASVLFGEVTEIIRQQRKPLNTLARSARLTARWEVRQAERPIMRR